MCLTIHPLKGFWVVFSYWDNASVYRFCICFHCFEINDYIPPFGSTIFTPLSHSGLWEAVVITPTAYELRGKAKNYLSKIFTAKHSDNSNTSKDGRKKIMLHSESSSSIEEFHVGLRNTLEEGTNLRVSFGKSGLHFLFHVILSGLAMTFHRSSLIYPRLFLHILKPDYFQFSCVRANKYNSKTI